MMPLQWALWLAKKSNLYASGAIWLCDYCTKVWLQGISWACNRSRLAQCNFERLFWVHTTERQIFSQCSIAPINCCYISNDIHFHQTDCGHCLMTIMRLRTYSKWIIREKRSVISLPVQENFEANICFLGCFKTVVLSWLSSFFCEQNDKNQN